MQKIPKLPFTYEGYNLKVGWYPFFERRYSSGAAQLYSIFLNSLK